MIHKLEITVLLAFRYTRIIVKGWSDGGIGGCSKTAENDRLSDALW